eukprot:TRINITY_DN25231_c0_g1_i1.p1 TRINITY_DN25231_c0_g1~~TRINITY_DN25231_c0_g1_i1.p1  ORF type:complete len:494 (+),score=83.98 TRINITY_DN25231_c0_g1_i1:116-1597(+)
MMAPPPQGGAAVGVRRTSPAAPPVAGGSGGRGPMCLEELCNLLEGKVQKLPRGPARRRCLVLLYQLDREASEAKRLQMAAELQQLLEAAAGSGPDKAPPPAGLNQVTPPPSVAPAIGSVASTTTRGFSRSGSLFSRSGSLFSRSGSLASTRSAAVGGGQAVAPRVQPNVQSRQPAVQEAAQDLPLAPTAASAPAALPQDAPTARTRSSAPSDVGASEGLEEDGEPVRKAARMADTDDAWDEAETPAPPAQATSWASVCWAPPSPRSLSRSPARSPVRSPVWSPVQSPARLPSPAPASPRPRSLSPAPRSEAEKQQGAEVDAGAALPADASEAAPRTPPRRSMPAPASSLATEKVAAPIGVARGGKPGGLEEDSDEDDDRPLVALVDKSPSAKLRRLGPPPAVRILTAVDDFSSESEDDTVLSVYKAGSRRRRPGDSSWKEELELALRVPDPCATTGDAAAKDVVNVSAEVLWSELNFTCDLSRWLSGKPFTKA